MTALRTSILLSLFFLFSVFSVSACGDPTDSPEDCTVNEYFDDGSELCRTCPALSEPTCAGGCGFFITEEDDRPCPVSRCLLPTSGSCECPASDPDCGQTCEDGEVFDARSFTCLSCDTSCDGTFEVTNGVCTCSS